MDQKVFIERLFALRTKFGISRTQLAEKIGVSKQAMGQFENGKVLPSIFTLVALADFFHVSLDYLVGRSDDSEPK